jgi:predicted metal-binding membrane protein
MVAIMIPSTVPAALLVDAAERRQGAAHPLARTLAFLAGCTAAWLLFSIVAALAHLGLSESAMLSPAMSMTSPSLAGGLLVLAGMFQWSPLKTRCLRGTRRQRGSAGSVLTGLQHGLFSVGCGWALIALLFVAGVMNLLWVAALAVFVLLEGTRIGERASRAAGALLTVAGALLLTSGLGV